MPWIRHIIFALRALLRHPGYLSLNLLGFGLGLACAFLALLFAWQEFRVDRFFDGGERTYRVGCSFMNMGGFASGPEALVPEILAHCPAVECGTRLKKYSTEKVIIGERTFEEENVLYVDSLFFRMFGYPFLSGNPGAVMRSADEVVLSATLAKKYFGDEPAVGQTIRAGEAGKDYRVTAVVGALPHASHLDGNMWLPLYSKLQNKVQPEWYSAAFYSYVRLREGASVKDLEKSLQDMLRTKIYPLYGGNTPFNLWLNGNTSFRWIVQPFRDIYLQSRLNFETGGGGDPDKVYGFLLIGCFILLIAMVNYVNLVTARASVRAKEIGIRKTLGISRGGLIRDLLLESVLFGLGAAGVGLLAAAGLLAAFKEITGSTMLDLTRYRFELNAGMILFALPVSILTGIYPALFLSRIQPTTVLKGEWGLQGNKNLRSALVVGQFTLALMLLIGSLGVFRQLDFMQQRDWGFRRDGICVVENVDLLGEKAQAFHRELSLQNGVEAASLSASLPAGSTMYFQTYQTPEMPQPISVKSFMVDGGFIPTLEMRLQLGRNFNAEMPTDTSNVILNEMAVKTLGLGADPLGAQLNGKLKVIGVVSDFNYETLHNPVGPLVLQYKPRQHFYAIARVAPERTGEFLQNAKDLWLKMAPGKPFSYYFLDESLAELSEKEAIIGKGVLLFTGLALFIACLGLFGLATFLTAQRSKEIGIRKVLGASIAGILRLLSVDFIKLVFIALLLATPLAWYGLQRWLEGFAYRTDIAWWIPLTAGLLAMLVAVVTVGFQSMRAALANPVNSLRNE
ncbi:MAG: ABC transporter permease [Thermoanaerobaculia bacterium]|nr:ABC transporter permease [Thermoanaerobaculia bacterium]